MGPICVNKRELEGAFGGKKLLDDKIFNLTRPDSQSQYFPTLTDFKMLFSDVFRQTGAALQVISSGGPFGQFQHFQCKFKNFDFLGLFERSKNAFRERWGTRPGSFLDLPESGLKF